jgi:hypothetical protein
MLFRSVSGVRFHLLPPGPRLSWSPIARAGLPSLAKKGPSAGELGPKFTERSAGGRKDRHGSEIVSQSADAIKFCFRGCLSGSVLVDESTDQPEKRLVLGTSFASSEKVSELDFGRRSAGRHVGFV